jgi:Domain of unknown function (DUF3786)
MFDINKFKIKEKNPELASQALLNRASDLRKELITVKPVILAHHTGAELKKSTDGEMDFSFLIFNKEVRLSYPSFIAFDANNSELPFFLQALILYYFATSNGTSLSGNWVSFADLPDGRMYSQAFQGYSGDQVAKAIGSDISGFHDCCEKAGGRLLGIADAAYLFQALPRMPLILAYWQGEDEFPSSCKVLFDSAACNYLPIDGCAIIGNLLVKNVLRATH